MQIGIWILIAALCISLATAIVTFTMSSRLVRSGSLGPVPLLLTSCCGGMGIWSAHVLAVQSFFGNQASGYGPVLLMTGLPVAVGATFFGLWVMADEEHMRTAAGGAIIGIGAVSTQFLSVFALGANGVLQWNAGSISAGILITPAIIAGAWIIHRTQSGWRALGAGSAAFAIAWVVLQIATAFGLSINGAAPAAGGSIGPDSTILPFTVMATSGLVLLTGYLSTLINRRVKGQLGAQQREIVDAVSEALLFSKHGRIVDANMRAAELIGRDIPALIGRNVHDDVLSRTLQRASPVRPISFASELIRADGERVPVRVVHRALRAFDGASEAFILLDLSEWAQKIAELTEENEALRADIGVLNARSRTLDDLMSAIDQGVCLFDVDQKVICSNAPYAVLYGLPPDAIQPEMSLTEVIQLRIDNGIFAGRSSHAYLENRINIGPKEDSIHELSNGRIIRVRRRPLSHGYWLALHDDITEQRQIEAQLAHLEKFDALTDLPGRAALRSQLDEILAVASRHHRATAVLMLCIDRFGEINDTMGHVVGDALLRLTAQRLQKSLRRGTVVGRFGGDTFLIIEGTEHPGKEAAALASRLLDDMRKPFAIGEATINVTATIGIALAPADGNDADTLLKHSDLALKQAKADTRDAYFFFERAMDRELKSRRALQQDLRTALAKNELELHFQPLVRLDQKQISGFEALIRWTHPVHGDVPPPQLLQLAEEAQMLPAVGKWLLRKACKEASDWPKHITVAVNVATGQFRSAEFVRTVMTALVEAGLPPERLELEVTEKVMEDDPEEAVRKLSELTGLGVRITLDNFGSGFASLAYLRRLSFNKIKIARGFLKEVTEREDTKVIVRTLLRMGAGFRVPTVAVGVETKEQLEFIRAEGCTEMQGHYFSAPKTGAEVRKLF